MARNDLAPPVHSMTLEDYRELERQGRLTRPLTDPPMRRAGSYLKAAPASTTRGGDEPLVQCP